MVHNIRKNWGDKKVTHGVFLDVSSAFDKVWHSGLLAKLSQVGIVSDFHNMMASYLKTENKLL